MTDLPAWVECYRGKPFTRGGDGPDEFDCYGLVRAVLRNEWGVEAPAMDDRWHFDAAAAIACARELPGSPWLAIDGAPAPGDVLTFAFPGQRELHVGIVVSARWMLSVRTSEGVRTERIDRMPWVGLRFGAAWRHRGICARVPS